MAQLAIKIAITPKANNQPSYEILDLIVVNGRAFLSIKDENTSPVTDTTAWTQITENTYDITVRLGYEGTEVQWLASLSAASEAAAQIALQAAQGASEVTSQAAQALTAFQAAEVEIRTQATEAINAMQDAEEEIRLQATEAINALQDADQGSVDRIFKTLRAGASGVAALKPTTSYFSYRLDVMGNLLLSIDLQKMINQVGSARCRLIIDMPILRTITFAKPILWGGTIPTFSTPGQYILEIVDVDGGGTPLIWLVATILKEQTSGVVLYVDSTDANYTASQINTETATRTTSTWSLPFKYLQNAINAANAGDVICVKAGVYKPTHLRTDTTTYTQGDHLNRNATFTIKTGVDIYGGFNGTETSRFNRIGGETILSGDILDEADLTGSTDDTIGDRRTIISKDNAAYNVVYAAVLSYTYIDGLTIKYGNCNGAGLNGSGGCVYSTNNNIVVINCDILDSSGASGAGFNNGTKVSSKIGYCTSPNSGACSHGGISTSCYFYNSFVQAARNGTVTYSTFYKCGNNTAVGGGTREVNNTGNIFIACQGANGAGWIGGTNNNCIVVQSTAGGFGSFNGGTNRNCISINNQSNNGAAWSQSILSINCIGINNVGATAVWGHVGSDQYINCLLFNNKNSLGVLQGFNNVVASGIKIFRNNAYDTNHPIITGGVGSDIDTGTCLQNITINDIKIEVPSFVGLPQNTAQQEELDKFIEEITSKLLPRAGSVLRGAGINNSTYSNTQDFTEKLRIVGNCTIGAIEGE